MAHRNWTRNELLLSLNLYCRTPFGKFHSNNPDIISLAQHIGRSPSAVAMKLVNFASLDPYHQQRQVSGLRNVSNADREIWKEFYANPESVVIESQEYWQAERADHFVVNEDIDMPDGPTERLRVVRTRLVQNFFRETVLASYDYQCTICSLAIAELLTASHIIPWSQNVERRADPRNGLALCAIHDRAFDRGLFTLDAQFQIVLSSSLKKLLPQAVAMLVTAFYDVEGRSIVFPTRFAPDPNAIEYHRHNIFKP